MCDKVKSTDAFTEAHRKGTYEEEPRCRQHSAPMCLVGAQTTSPLLQAPQQAPSQGVLAQNGKQAINLLPESRSRRPFHRVNPGVCASKTHLPHYRVHRECLQNHPLGRRRTSQGKTMCCRPSFLQTASTGDFAR